MDNQIYRPAIEGALDSVELALERGKPNLQEQALKHVQKVLQDVHADYVSRAANTPTELAVRSLLRLNRIDIRDIPADKQQLLSNTKLSLMTFIQDVRPST